MRAMFAAIVGALRAIFSFARAVISVPGRLVAGLLGGSATPPPAGDSPLVTDLKAELAEATENTKRICERIAAAIAAWCADSMIAGRPLPAPRPPQVSRAVANWLPGLTREECAELVCAGKQEVCDHISGVREIPGVRPVQSLVALDKWDPLAPLLSGTPGFAVIAAELAAGPSTT
jgi:hypothetical protein